MINTRDILETINMIHEENLDIRTITMGISLYDCVSEDENRLCEKIYDKGSDFNMNFGNPSQGAYASGPENPFTSAK